MAKEKKAHKPKGEGRTPSLAPFVDGPFKIYMTTGGKEYDGQVLSSGIIRIDEKDFTSPSSAGSYILGKDEKGKPRQVDGWKCWSFNKDGKRVLLDSLRGSKSPLKAEAPKKERKAKAAKPATEKKARISRKPEGVGRKPRAVKKTAKPNGASQPDITDADLPNDNEASAPF